MKSKITINLNHLIGKVEITIHPCGSSNLSEEHLEKQLLNLESQLTATILRSIQNAEKLIESADHEGKDQSTECR